MNKIVIAGLVLLFGILVALSRCSERYSVGPPPESSADRESEQTGADALDVGLVGSSRRQQLPENERGDLPAREGTEIRVLNERGNGVPGAQLFLVLGDREEALGATGSLGRFLANRHLREGLLVTTAVGYARAETDLVQASASIIEVDLSPDSPIAGTVRDAFGEPAVGLHVLAYPFLHDQPNARLVQDVVDGKQVRSLLLATTDQSGRFEIRGGSERYEYLLSAGGRGYMTRTPGVSRAGDSPIDLVVYSVYGAVISIVDDNGMAIVGCDATRTGGATRAWHGSEGVADVRGIPVAAVLAGVRPETYEGAGSEVFLFTAEESVPSISPNHFQARYVGYEPTMLEFSAPLLAHGLANITVVLTRIAMDWGTLRVEFSGALVLDDVPRYPEGVVLLTDLSTGERLRYAIDSPNRAWTEIRNVPYGQYEVQFSAKHGLFRFPDRSPVAVTVGKSPATFTIELAPTGAVRVFPLKNGQPYSGILVLQLSVGVPDLGTQRGWRRRGVTFRVFDGRSYYLANGLLPGHYNVNLIFPVQTDSEQWPGEVVEVRDGEVVSVALDLDQYPAAEAPRHEQE